MRMKPSPTLHRSSTESSRGNVYTVVSGWDVDPVTTRTYGHMGEVPLELLSDLVGKLAARYRQAVPSPVQYMNLPHLMVNICGCVIGFSADTPGAN